MSWTDIRAGLDLLRPEVVLTVLVMFVIVADLIAHIRSRIDIGILALVGTLVALVVAIMQFSVGGSQGSVFLGSAAPDNYSLFFRITFLVASAVVILFSIPVVAKWKSGQGEFYALVVACTLGMCVMAVANNLLMMYLGLEFVSLTSYVLAGMLPRNRKSAEASLKYVIYGAAASGMMIYGMSLLYGLTGTLQIDEIGRKLADLNAFGGEGLAPTMALVIGVLVMAGFGYKVAAVPFHMWCPDVYEGAPTPVTAFFSVGPKAAGFAMLGRFVAGVFQSGDTSIEWNYILAALAVVTMAVGNLAALQQQNLKRLMAYSSIGHAGYLLLGFTVFGPENVSAIMFYIVAYLIMNLGAFLVLIVMEEKYGITTVDECRGLGWRAPALGTAMTVFLISLAGLPPTAGFFGKLLIFGYVLKAGGPLNYSLVIVAVLFSVVSLYYYARIIAAFFLVKPREGEVSTAYGAISTALLGVLGLATLALGVAPSWVMEWAGKAAAGLLGRI